jgi:YebC/PmpR family DNA-binding regulatory protein
MAGHSKWANIKRHKAKQDAKRGKIYTKLIREITVAAKLHGSDPNANPRLRVALDKAFEANMSKDVIERAIKRGEGGTDGEAVEEIRYEGYGPQGVAIIVDCLTDNRTRTVAAVRHAFTKHGGQLGTDGSVAYLFKKVGQLIFPPETNEEQLTAVALELEIDDVIVNEDHSIEVITTPHHFESARTALMTAGFKPAQADITMRAATHAPVSDQETLETILSLVDTLEDLDDVQTVYTNADL